MPPPPPATTTEHHLETPRPVHLHVENSRGSVEVSATDTTESRVRVDGTDAELVQVRLDGDDLVVAAPRTRNGFLGGADRSLDITVSVPSGSTLSAKLGSADLHVRGRLGEVSVRSGSGDVDVEHVAQPLRLTSGSGDVTVGTAEADVSVSTGSGDVSVARLLAAAAVKTGSGDLHVGHCRHDVTFSTGSGDLVVTTLAAGRLRLKAGSGDVSLGIPAGTPVWTDLTTVSGRISSDLAGGGQPEPGQDHVELRATTVSGDIHLLEA